MFRRRCEFGYFSRKDRAQATSLTCAKTAMTNGSIRCRSGGRNAGDRAFMTEQKDAAKADCEKDVRRLLVGNRRNDATALQMADLPDDAL